MWIILLVGLITYALGILVGFGLCFSGHRFTQWKRARDGQGGGRV